MHRKLISLLIGFAFIAASCSQPPPSPSNLSAWPTRGWRSAAPEEQGFDSAILADALTTMREEPINIHSLLVVRRGEIILDAYFYPYDGQTPHEFASVTKSVMTTLVAIAVDQGKLRLDDRMVGFFPDRTIANQGVLKNYITVRHLSEMASGLDCVADYDEQTLTEMGLAPDWVQFTLDLKMRDIPGTRFEYCSPGLHVLSAILQEATGMTAAEFARTNLFEPLGIRDYLWEVDPQGYNDGWAGLYLYPRDAAKIGLLMLQGGQWDGEQIVSAKWVANATRLQQKTGMGDDYGYGWWIPPATQYKEYAAEGRGGQYIRVLPDLDLIVVTTGGGFAWNDIVPLLAPAMADMVQPLPVSPEGIQKVDSALKTILEPPQPQPVPPLTETGWLISGKTYIFEPNPLNLIALKLEFDASPQAHLLATFTGQPDRDLRVGLDGVYRVYPIGEHNLPLGVRGAWIDDQTFLLEYDSIANREAYAMELRFEAENVSIRSKERTHEAYVTAVGHLQDR